MQIMALEKHNCVFCVEIFRLWTDDCWVTLLNTKQNKNKAHTNKKCLGRWYAPSCIQYTHTHSTIHMRKKTWFVTGPPSPFAAWSSSNTHMAPVGTSGREQGSACALWPVCSYTASYTAVIQCVSWQLSIIASSQFFCHLCYPCSQLPSHNNLAHVKVAQILALGQFFYFKHTSFMK